MALCSSHPVGGQSADRSQGTITSRLGDLRSRYYNGFEKFFWAPDDVMLLTPQRKVWYSGQARYHESVHISDGRLAVQAKGRVPASRSLPFGEAPADRLGYWESPVFITILANEMRWLLNR